jgi:chemotaxis signal transduction protein
MRNTNQIAASEQRVLIFSALTPRVSNRQIYFLFSQYQMEDILMDTSVQSVPLSPSYIEGVAEWRNQVLPVISLEACLGMESLNSHKVQRLMVVRALKNEAAPMGIYRIMLRIVPPIRMLTLPIECSPVSVGWIPEIFFTKGVYEWEDGFLVVAHMKNILNGRN